MRNDELVHAFIEITALTESVNDQYYLSPYLISSMESKSNGKNPIHVPIIGNKLEYNIQKLSVKYNKELVKNCENLEPFKIDEENVNEENKEHIDDSRIEFIQNVRLHQREQYISELKSKTERHYLTLTQALKLNNSGLASHPVIRIPQKYRTLINQEECVMLYVGVMVKVNEKLYFHPKKGFTDDSVEDEIQIVNPTKILLTKENVSDDTFELKLAVVNLRTSNKIKKSFSSLNKIFSHTVVHKYNLDNNFHEEFNVFKSNESISKDDRRDYYFLCIIGYKNKIDWKTQCLSSKMTKTVKENENQLFQIYQLDKLHLAFTLCTRQTNNNSNYRRHTETTVISDQIIYQGLLADKKILNPVQILIQPATIQRPRTYMEQLKQPRYIQGSNENSRPTTEVSKANLTN
ncbi:unnamed protein product [Didymodactylos carnosus]|uniref:Uncharacterized protein n=1 Tax=Didymodactylos carnosus TaxID=1234261 RepID=A0A8S2HWR5_9BILA|nr:unnamed protein product [Didymodactylos carnosus]CAF3668339.1 unnamed protein product [Didymodactylos carnosus]